MKAKEAAVLGFCIGSVIGGAATILGAAPKITAILMKPLAWLISGLNPYPSESPANLIIAIPLMLLYWGLIGAILGLVLYAIILAFRPKGNSN